MSSGNVWGQYTVNFEGAGETKNAYGSGNVSLSGIQWNMTEALIGTAANDYKNGVRSARIRGHSSSSMTMNSNKSNGLGSISFKYWRYGTDGQATWKVEYSTNNGSTWTQAGSNFTPPANNNEQTFSATSINVTGNVRVRIIHVSGGNISVDRRFNIDDITLTDYVVANPSISSSDSLSALTTTYGTVSSNTTFNVSGTNMTAGILVTPPAGFEVSQSANSGFGSATTVGSAGTIASTPVYVRLAATTVPGTYSGNIVLSSSGASNVNVATVSSTVSTKNLTISGLTGNNKVYDGNTTVSVTGTAAYAGLENGESFTPSSSVTWAFPNADVGTNIVLTRTGSYSAPSSNYTVTQPSLTANITAKTLTITANNVTKTAGLLLTDGVGSTAFSSVGLVGSESIGSVSIAYGSAGATTGDGATPGVYLNQVTPSAATAGTFLASNYDITYVSGTITVEEAPANPTITVTGSLSGLSTIYGAPSTSTSFTVSGAAMNEGITITPPIGFEVATSSNFSTTIGTNSAPLIIGSAGIIANATIYVRLRAVATVVGSPYSGNITLTSSGASSQNIATVSSSVSAKNLTINGLTGTNKVYDGSTTATVTGTAEYSALANGESFAIVGTANYSFTNAAIGTSKTITVTGFEAPSSNYTITQPSLSANITAKALTVTGASASNKTYDRTNTATISGGTLVGVVSPDVVSLIPTGTFAQIGVGTSISVTSTSTLGGAGAGNYTLTQPTGLSADITAKVVTLTSPAATNKIYDATTTAIITGTLNGVIVPDAVTLSGTGTFAQVNTGSGISVTSTATLSGANSGNYTLIQPTNLTANIIAKTLSITAASVASKTYDGSTTSGTVTTGTLSGFVGLETVSVSSATGTFANANVGTGKTATIVYTLANGLNGGLASNYSLANTTASGNITAKSLSITAATIASKIYNGTTATGTITAGTLTGFVGSETVGITSATGVYQDANVGTGKSATISYVLGNGSNGGLAANYALSTTSANGDITPKSLTVTANNVTKEIGTTLTGGAGSADFTSSGLVLGQTIGSVTITYGTGAGAGAAVGTYSNQVIPSAATGGTFFISNYSITYLVGNIVVQNTTAIVLSNMGAAVVEDFDSMGSNGTASLPIGVRRGNNFTSATSTATFAYGTSGAGVVTGTSSGGTINWANGVTASATDRALGILNTGSISSPQYIVASVLNTTESTINSIEIDWDYEKYRSGSRAFDWTFFHGNNVSPTIAATGGNQSYSADANNTTVFNPPTAISKTVILNNLSIESGQRYYFLWTFTGNGGSTNGQGIGIDNLSIKPCRTTSITSQPSSTAQSTCINGTAFSPLSVTASGTDLVFQWEQSTDGVSGWIAAVGGTGSTTNSFTPSNVSAGTIYYRCIITNGCGEITTSELSAAITVSNNNNWIGTGGLWSDTANWSCGSVPLDSSIITISSGTPTLDVNFTVGNSGSLTLEGNASLIIAPTASLTVDGSANFNARPVLFESDATGTAEFGAMTGTLSGATNVTTQRYFPAKRAFRFTSSAVTTNTTIRENWQENVNNSNTTFSNNQNPNPGFGTHITGAGGSANGFDTTISNASSLFTFNNATALWTAVANTNVNTLNAGVPYRINVRGDRSIDMSLTSPTATPTTLRATGTLYTGTFAPSNLSNTAFAYNFIGNPYQAPVNMKTVLDNATNLNNLFYYVWDPTLNTRGAYVSVDLSTTNGTPNIGSANKFLQPGQACFVRTAANGGATMTFEESYKNLSGSNNLVFKNANQSISATSNIKMKLYDSNSLALNQTPLDGSIIFFDDSNNNGVDQNDAAKFANPDEMFSTFNNGALISIEKRMQPTTSDIIPIRISQYRGTNYTIVAQGENLNGIPAYLHDQFLQTYTEIPQSGSVNYPYTVVTTNTQTSATDRFRIVYSNPLLNTANNEWKNFTLYPNPSKQGNFNIILGQPLENGKVTIYNTLGVKVYNQDLENTIENSITPNQSMPTGIYYVEIQNGNEKSIKKLIIE
ncbi:hypothetical protein GCM10022389_29390 [Flavobacterium cheonanense]|uniref:Ig-like domain-containing protein n=2 Tax=Flavobacterium cheonanense TaxID=706183 RepID=A0ABP7W5L1_9FLAO